MRYRHLLAALFLSFLSCLWSNTASATLLYSGGEDVDFVCNINTSCGIQTNGSTFRPAWSRYSYEVVGSTDDPPPGRFATTPFTPSAVIWTHGYYCNDDGGCPYYVRNYTTANEHLIRLIDTSGNVAIVVRGTGNTGELKISSRTAAGAYTDLVTCPSAFGVVPTQLDLYVNYGSTGEVALYTQSVKVCGFTGNVTNGDGATKISQEEFASVLINKAGAWSEIIIADTDTRAMARYSVTTAANGTTTGFSSSNGASVCGSIWNALGSNDTIYAYTGTANVTHECTINSGILPGAYSVLGLVMSARAVVGSTGVQHFDFVTRTGGTDYLSSDKLPLNSFSNVSNYTQTVNPATNAAWAISDLQAAGFNIGLKSKP